MVGCEPWFTLNLLQGLSYGQHHHLFNSIQRTYRNAIVELIRQKLLDEFGDRAVDEVKTPFGNKEENGNTQWENVKIAAQERRSGGTGELSTPIRDEFELLGVERYFSVFDKYFDVLCPSHSQKPPKEKTQAKQALTAWMKQVKNVRDPVSHPVSDDISYDDSVQVLYCTRKVLDFCGLPEPASQIMRQQSILLGGITREMESSNEEWTASASVAELGIKKFGEDQGLLFRLGYALHRQGRELILEKDLADGTKLCRKAEEKLERARDVRNSEERNYSLRNQINRAIALNFEALEDGAQLARHFARWQGECPGDACCESEYQRLRSRFPQYLRAH